ncbi:unnamed protein product [Parascedosporium putredinis]|uniref:ubiquitinyl hydrolase 1 n=1 Tax=Parascedosporium putredinis TaxID=1442378 RepID=A0A9P1MG81_9PEZI|nr:unnamed protein product [Parascedosporium putredinis]CAI8003955.1 unnamed protein product [Parascedosporium putredinis]
MCCDSSVLQQHDARYGGRSLLKAATTTMALKLTPRGQGAKGFRPDEVVESGWGYETPAGLFSLPYVRSAPLFIHDLFDHNLWEWKEFMALEVDKSSFAKEFDPSRVKNLLESRSTPAVPPTKHMMILLPSQTCIHPDGSRTISAVCFHCLYHFTLRIQANSGHDLCRVRAPTGGTNIADAINGPHQLYLENRNLGPASAESRYNPVILRGLYACTSEQCGLQVVVEVSAPRIDAKWIDLLTNQDRIKKRLEDLKAADPERFDIGPNEWHKAGLRQLVTYLKDLLDAADHGKEPRTLSKRNKRFEAVMGPEFYELFRFLEYKEFSRVNQRCSHLPLSLLGILPDFHPKLVYNSRAKLSAFLPDFKATFEDSMYSIARDTSGHLGLNAEFLRRAKAVVGEDSDDMFNETWGLAPSNIRRTDDEVITAVRKKLRDSPEAVDIIFEMLPVYARSRGSKRLLRLIDWVSTLLPMPIDLAFDVLGARPDDSAKQLILNAQTRVKLAKAATIANAMRAIARYREDSVLSRQAEITAEGPITNPVGLENIGNTCYLNSIIQYLYTVQPIRGLIDEYAENKLEIDDMEKRRIGGSKVKVQPVDLVIGHYFTGEALQTLFAQMTTVFRGPCAPSQGLANAVLLSSEQLLRLAKSAAEPQAYAGMFPAPSTNVRRTPPPLPARPTPAVPLKQADETTNDPDPPLIDLTGPSRSSSPTLMGDAASDRSFDQTKVDAMEISEEAATAVNADADAKMGQAPGVTVLSKAKDDVEMTDGETVASGDDEGSVKSTADTPDSETEGLLNTLKVKHELTMIQQDVDEIMGRVLGLLQASIKPTSIENDIQIETVMQTFFFKVIMRTISYQDGDLRTPHETKSAEFFRNLTAYPAPDGPCTLYQALDNNFDQEEIEGTTTSRYSSIESLPPILHVLVQRTKETAPRTPTLS